MATATGTGKDLSNLDIVRAVAVLSVVISHLIAACWPTAPLYRFGAFGVALFFTHTSLVLMWSLGRRPDTVDFYIRRAFRIYPLAVFAILVTLCFHAPVGVGEGSGYFRYASLSVPQIFEHFLLVQNLFSGNQLIYVMWSLPLEAQMYLLLPSLYFQLERKSRVWPLLLSWALIWLFCAKEFSGYDLNLIYSACFFLPGVMAYVGFSRWSGRLPAWSFTPFLAVVLLGGGVTSSWKGAALVALPFGLLLPLFRQIQSTSITKPCWYVAKYSYGAYLLHPFGLVLGFYLLPNAGRPIQIAIFTCFTLLSSVLAYHLIEEPLIKLGSRVARDRASLQRA